LLALGHPPLIPLNGSCVATTGDQGAAGIGAFSGAALASQALSELSETTTQETTSTAFLKIDSYQAAFSSL